jgi:hypothetical protein
MQKTEFSDERSLFGVPFSVIFGFENAPKARGVWLMGA